jgi:ABC-type phosphate transport system permease subunit
VAILVEELQVQEPRSSFLAPTLAALLALPSVAMLLVGVSIWVYVAAAWAVALGALALGLLALRPQFKERYA